MKVEYVSVNKCRLRPGVFDPMGPMHKNFFELTR